MSKTTKTGRKGLKKKGGGGKSNECPLFSSFAEGERERGRRGERERDRERESSSRSITIETT